MKSFIITSMLLFVTACASGKYSDNVPPPSTFDYYDCMKGVKVISEYKEREPYCRNRFR